jgi:hypothetical protein
MKTTSEKVIGSTAHGADQHLHDLAVNRMVAALPNEVHTLGNDTSIEHHSGEELRESTFPNFSVSPANVEDILIGASRLEDTIVPDSSAAVAEFNKQLQEDVTLPGFPFSHLIQHGEDIGIPAQAVTAVAARASLIEDQIRLRDEKVRQLGLPSGVSDERINAEHQIVYTLKQAGLTPERVKDAAHQLIGDRKEERSGSVELSWIKFSSFSDRDQLFEKGWINPSFLKAVAAFSIPLLGWANLHIRMDNRDGTDQTRVFPPFRLPDTDQPTSPALQALIKAAAQEGCILTFEASTSIGSRGRWDDVAYFQVPVLSVRLSLPEIPKA